MRRSRCEVLDGRLDRAHVDADGEVQVLVEDVAVAVLPVQVQDLRKTNGALNESNLASTYPPKK
jgi:hypothetical protein